MAGLSHEEAELRAHLSNDLRFLRVQRGLNALGAFVTSMAEVCFAAVSIWFAGTRQYELGALFGSLSGFATIADSAFRFRETASSAHVRIVQLRGIATQLHCSTSTSRHPLWDEYQSARTQNYKIDYLTSIYEFAVPPKEYDLSAPPIVTMTGGKAPALIQGASRGSLRVSRA